MAVLGQAAPDLGGAARPRGKKVQGLLVGPLALVARQQLANRGGIENLALPKTCADVRRERECIFAVEEDVHPLQPAPSLKRDVRNGAWPQLLAAREDGGRGVS